MDEFNEVYKNIDKDRLKLKNFRKKSWITILISIVLDILLFCLLKQNLGVMKAIPICTFIIIFIYLIIQAIKYFGKYNRIYQDKIISNIIKAVDENIEYIPKARISEIVYREANFESFERYQSSNLIKGNVQMAQVTTTKTERDEEGNKTIKTVFSGLFGYYKMQQEFTGFLRIQKNVKNFFTKVDMTKLEMDSSAFENEFDVYTDNKILAMQILTSDILEDLTEIKKLLEEDYEILIQKDKIYMRVYSNKLFTMKGYKSLEYDSLKRCYKMVEVFQSLPLKIENILKENT